MQRILDSGDGAPYDSVTPNKEHRMTTAQDDVQILENLSQASSERTATVIVEGPSMSQLQSAATRTRVLEYAGGTLGLSKPGISSQGGAYPAHAAREDGTVDEAKVMQPNPEGRFRLDFQITSAL